MSFNEKQMSTFKQKKTLQKGFNLILDTLVGTANPKFCLISVISETHVKVIWCNLMTERKLSSAIMINGGFSQLNVAKYSIVFKSHSIVLV